MLQPEKIENQNVQDILPLTPLQAGILFYYLQNGASNYYYEQLCIRLCGEIDLELMCKAWELVISGNELLRTVFRWEKLSHPIQIILKSIPTPIRIYDLSELDDLIKEQRVLQLKTEDFAEKIDLTYEPFRISLLKLSDSHCVMIITNHHILYDGWSNGIIMKEFLQFYHTLFQGTLPVISKKNSFKEFLKLLKSQDKVAQKNYWQQYLVNFDSKTQLPLSIETPIPPLNTPNSPYSVILDDPTTALFKHFITTHRITPAALFYSVWSFLLQKYNNCEDVVFGTIVSGRNTQLLGLEEMVGLFINTIPLRSQTNAHETLLNSVQKIDQDLRKRTAYENYPLVDIKAVSLIESKENLFDSIVVIENYPLDLQLKDQSEFLKVESYTIDEASNYDLTLVVEMRDQIVIQFLYNISRFSSAQIQWLGEHFYTILTQILSRPTEQFSRMELLSTSEKNRIIYEFNNTYTDYPREKTIHELFDLEAKRHPDCLAVVYEGKNLTFYQLNTRADSLSQVLRAKGVNAETVVGIIAERSLEMIIGVLAILKAGGAYLPIDPEYPKDRINLMLEDSAVKLLLTPGEFKLSSNFAGLNCDFLDISTVPVHISLDIERLANLNTSASLAYIIYTSGSTGRPKGVMVEHRNVLRLVKNPNYINMTVNDKILQTGTLAFDASTFEIWGALLNGLELHLGSKDLILHPAEMEYYLTQNQISILWLTAPLFNLMAEEKPGMFRNLKYLLVGGDVVSPKQVNKVRNECSNIHIINGYGPTENTTFSTTYLIAREHVNNIPIGKPISNSTAYILDRYDNLSPIGIFGELCVGGDGLARGYVNNPTLTTEKFVSNPLIPNSKIYRTGDLARWLPDGMIEFQGRADQQVKIRGFRVELGEIENVILSYDLIKEATVVVREDSTKNKYLCAYFTAKSDIIINELKDYLVKHLPDYMIPLYFLQLDKLPLNTNGKIDRQALPEPESKLIFRACYEGPRNRIEATLVSIWQELLGIEQVSINDNFFELGGHSLKVMSLITRIHKDLSVELPLREVFQKPTIKELAILIQQLKQKSLIKILPVEESEYYEVSSAQKRIFILQQMNLVSINYNISAVFLVTGDLNLEKFQQALFTLSKRHDALRTSFHIIENKIVQKVHNNVEYQLMYLLNTATTVNQLQEIIDNHIKPFDLSKAPLMRVGILKLGENKHLLIVDMHHIISDGISMAIIAREIGKLYASEELENLKIQYKDFSAWQNHRRENEISKEYWLNRLGDELPVLNLSTDYPRPMVQSQTGDLLIYPINPQLSQNIVRIAQNTSSTLYMVLLSGLNILLAKYTGQTDIIIGSPVAGRPHVDLESIIGMFVNTLVMRNYPEGAKTFTEFLAEVKENALQAYEHQDYQFEELVDKLNLQQDLQRNPLFDVMFAVENMLPNILNWVDLELTPYSYQRRTAKFDLTIFARENNGEIVLEVEYCTELFKKETIERMVTHLTNIFITLKDNLHIPLNAIELMNTEEKTLILHQFNNTYTDYPNEKTIIELFIEQVEKHPESVAVVCAEQKLTYRVLNERANALSKILRRKGVKEDTIVAILTERSPEMIIGILAIIKAGGAYLPIDPEYPANRIRHLIQECSVQLILTEKGLNRDFPCATLEISTEFLSYFPQPSTTPESLAYVIYTSGSTGNPKGVMVEHHSVVRLVKNPNYVQFVQGDKILQTGTLAFDASTFEIWGALLNGLELHLAAKELIISPEELANYLFLNQISIIFLTTSLFNLMAEANPAMFTGLRFLLTGGEVISPKHVKKVQNACTNLHIIHCYGPTENTTFSTFYPIIGNDLTNIPIGRPISNSTVYILDKANQLCPVGVVGELCVGGQGVARGYINNPLLTLEKFIQNPYNVNEQIYRTGDLARWLPDGNIEFFGRVDQQVKIRGFRIELSEIENTLLKHAEIKEAVVIARTEATGSKYLAAYYVAPKEIKILELREYLLEILPDYMIPAYFLRLDKLPLNKNGKIDRKALPEPVGNIMTGVVYEAPSNVLEKKLLTIWQEILLVQGVGINDNFFDLGGHSLKATLLNAKIYQQFNVQLPLREIFQHPTIKELAIIIQRSAENKYIPIEPVEKQEYYPASSAQKRLYIQNQFESNGISYNMPMAVTIKGELNVSKFKECFKILSTRHETLRTSFEMLKGEIIQKIAPNSDLTIDIIDGTESQIEEILRDFVCPFDLKEAPLLRIGLIKLTTDKHIMLFDMHHIISDGLSMEILIRDFLTIYQDGKLDNLKVQYKDFTIWQNTFFTHDLFFEQEKYWLNVFAGESPVLNLPTDYPRPSIQSFKGAQVEFALNEELTSKLQNLSAETGSTLYMLLLAAYAVLLSKYTGQEEIVIGTPVAGRRHPDVQNIIGMFVNMLALKNNPVSGKTFREFISEVKENTLQAFEHQDYPFEELIEKLNIQRDLSRNPLFDTVFTLQNSRFSVIETESLHLFPFSLQTNIAKFDLTLDAFLETGKLSFSFEYCTDLFAREKIEQMQNHYTYLLSQVVTHPDKTISTLAILTPTEMNELLYDFNATDLEYARDMTIHELIEEKARKVPEKVAIVFAGDKLTYKELSKRTNKLANLLQEHAVCPEEIVGIMADRSIEMIIGIIGVLKAGGAYMPIDPDYPVERIKYMLEDSGARILLTHHNYAKKIAFTGQIFDLAESINDAQMREAPKNLTNAQNLAYIMYTSGSTGKPKGVMLTHRGVVNLAKYYNEIFALEEGRAIAHTANVSFDASIGEIFPPLIYGTTIFIFKKEQALDRKEFIKAVREYGINIAQFVPMTLKEILADNEKPDCLNTILVAGDKLDDTLKDHILSLGYQLTNHYGPTEGTVDSIVTRCEKSKTTIGKPIANTRVYILDKDDNLCPIGVQGELCVAGDGLARGYLHKPELTAAKFVENPFRPEKIYRTGDLASWQADGNITFHGRIDSQVKIRGYRVELSEIETQLLKHNEITAAVVIDKADANGNKYLCGYFTANLPLTMAQVRAHLVNELPDYMVPSHFMQIDQIPVNANGKVDRRTLPEIEGGLDIGSESVAPTNDLEAKLVHIWEEVLGLSGIGITHNFFEIGGHSLKATTLVAKIHQELEQEVTLSEIFKNPTIKELAERLAHTGKNLFSTIQPVEEKAYYQASFAQKRLYILCQMENVGISYNMPGAVMIEGLLNEERLNQSFKKLINRHETLRTSFGLVDGAIVQQIHLEVEFAVSNFTTDEESVTVLIKKFVQPFDLTQAPLFRAGVIKLAKEKHLLLFDMHHLISDGVSMDILIKEFASLYQGQTLNHLKIQYKDFAVWQTKLFNSNSMLNQENYWLNIFAGEIPVLNMPTDYPRPLEQSFTGSTVNFVLEAELTRKLSILMKETGVTLYMALLTCYTLLLAKYTGQEDIVIGSPIAGRSHADLEQIIGIFVNTLTMRNYPRADIVFKDFLLQVKENALQAYENQDYPFEELIKKLNIPRDMGRNPLFDTMFMLQNTENTTLELENLKISPYNLDHTIAKFDLTLSAEEKESKIICTLEYSTKLYRQETMVRFAEHFKNLLTSVLDNPDQKIADIAILSLAEQEKILHEFNNTTTQYPRNMTIHQLFAVQADQTPERIALKFADMCLTYRELNDHSTCLAHLLRKKGISHNMVVGLMLKRSVQMIIGILGILKAGGVYLPIDPAFPKDRVKYMLEDSGANILIVDQDIMTVEFDGELIFLADQLSLSESGYDLTDSLNRRYLGSPTDLAYLIYTSGSTGKPKGVAIEHKSALNFIQGIINCIDFREEMSILCLTTISFDIFFLETLLPLTQGLCVVIANESEQLDPAQLEILLLEHKINILQLTPSRLSMLINTGYVKGLVNLNTILVGGEPFPLNLWKELQQLTKAKIFNMYGPTETTVWSTIDNLTEAEKITIGKPIANTRIYILNHNSLQPIGVPGELCIAGEGLARGYYNRPDLTTAKFTPDPFITGEKMYHTGDLACWLADGTIEFLGRIDQQVKIRGYRIEPSEIEALLLKQPRVTKAVVLAKEDIRTSKVLCAYLVSEEEELDFTMLKEQLAKELPDYMLPSYFIQLKSLPLTPNGKLDWKALPTPESRVTEVEYIPPANALEEQLAEIWQEVLGISSPGVTQNFFVLGGHSLKATILAARIHQKLHVQIPLNNIFANPTIKEIAHYIATTQEKQYIPIMPVEEKEYYPVSPAQKRLYILCQFEGAGKSYNMPGVLGIEGNFDPTKLSFIFQQLILRHETLRTSFELVDSEIVQYIHKDVEFALTYLEGTEAQLTEIITEFVRPFDFNTPPLLRIGLVKLPERYVLLFDMHHLISDGTSLGILIKEFATLYQGKTLPELKIQYKDFTAWQAQHLKTDLIQEHENYWLQSFAGEIPVLNLSTDFQRPTVQSFEGGNLSFAASPKLTDQLKSLTKKTDTTLYMVLLAAYNLLLTKYTGQEDIIIGSPIAGRTHADTQNLIGMFVNTLALRNYPSGTKLFSEFLHEVKATAMQAYEHQDYPFDQLVEKLNLTRDLSRNALFDTIFVLQNMDFLLEIPGLTLRSESVLADIAQYDLVLEAQEFAEGTIQFNFKYARKLFKEETIQRLSVHYLNILWQVSENIELFISRIDPLDEAEKCQLLVDFNTTEYHYPKETAIYELFEAQVKKSPDNLAIIFAGQELTYGELNEKADQLAWVLRKKGVKPETIVGILTPRSLEMAIGIFGILKAGGAFLPIDPEYSPERITYMLTDSQSGILLTTADLACEVNFQGEIISLTEITTLGTIAHGDFSILDCANLPKLNQLSDLAYVIYTSGSTGKPKGVMIEHQSVTNIIQWRKEMLGLGYGDSVLQLLAYCFDGFVASFFTPLISGAKVVFVNENEVKNPLAIREYIITHEITYIVFVPSLYALILENLQPEDLAKIKKISLGGETTSPELLKESKRKNPALELINEYGPTESTVTAIVQRDMKDSVIIGKPIGNTRIYIVNEYGTLQPIGVKGELCISGIGLARGYLNRPELTAEKFVLNPFTKERMYKTGDLARWHFDGMIEFCGRMDHQVKIRGYRIELGEVESQLGSYPGIKEVCVIDREDEMQAKYLCAYFVGEREFTVNELREYLARELPHYMIPSYFVQLEKMPLNTSGKIERKALPKPQGMAEFGTEYVAPRHVLEHKLVTIWQEVLGIEGIGITHNFFEIGGHSLKAATLVSKIHKVCNVEVPLSEFFKNPTVKELAQYITLAEEKTYQAILPVKEMEYYPASSAQRRIHIQWQLDKSSTAYNMPTALILEGNLDQARFIRAIHGLHQRHEALRTFFILLEGETYQKIHENVHPEINNLEIEEEKLKGLLQQFIKPFDLGKAPLLRVTLIKLTSLKYLLLFDMHHIISDGLSMAILTRDFAALYQGRNLPALRVQYKDYAVWHNSFLESTLLKKQRQYWLDKLEGFSYTEFPARRIITDYTEGITLQVEISEELTARISEFCQERQITKFAFMLAIFKIIIMNNLNQNDLTIGLPTAGRRHEDLENMIGVFLNILVIRTIIEKTATFGEYLANLTANLLEAQNNHDYPYEYLYSEVKDLWNFREQALFSIMFNYMPDQEELHLDGITVKPYNYQELVPKYSFTLYVNESREKIFINAVCKSDLSESMIENILNNFAPLILQILNYPEIIINQIALTGADISNQYSEEFAVGFDNQDFF